MELELSALEIEIQRKKIDQLETIINHLKWITIILTMYGVFTMIALVGIMSKLK